MVAPLTQYDQDQPILQETAVKSTAEGENAIADSFGKASQVAFEAGAKLEDTQSKAMFLQSVGLSEDLKTSAQQKLLENPGQAKQIADQTAQTAETIKQNSYVNAEDRARLNYFVDRNVDAVGVDATKVAVDQRRLGVQYNFFSNFGTSYNAYRDAAIAGDKSADDLKNAMLSTIKGAMSIKAITPQQAVNAIQAITHVTKDVQDFHTMFDQGDADAGDYHTANANILSQNNLVGRTPDPIDGNTKWLVDYYTNDHSKQKVESDINDWKLPNPQDFLNGTDDDRQKWILQMQGARQVQGLVNKGTAFPILSTMLDDLSQKGRILDYKDTAVKAGLERYFDFAKNGDFLKIMSLSPDGGKIMNDYLMRKSAISEFSDPADQDRLQRNNDNDLIWKGVSWAQARNWPGGLIRPFDQATVITPVENAMVAGQDIKPIFDMMNKYDQDVHPYLANSLSTPLNRMVFNTASLARDTGNSDQQIRAYILGSQKGQDFSALDVKDGTKINDIRAQIAVGIRDQLDFILKQNDPTQSGLLYNAMLESGVNMAKQLAIQNNDPQMNKSSWFGSSPDYAKQAVNFLKNAYPIKTGSNYMVNDNQGKWSDQQLSAYAHFINGEGYKNISGKVPTETMEEIQDRNPLTATISPTNDLMSVGADGNVYASIPITTSLLSHAMAENEKRVQEKFSGSTLLQEFKNK